MLSPEQKCDSWPVCHFIEDLYLLWVFFFSALASTRIQPFAFGLYTKFNVYIYKFFYRKYILLQMFISTICLVMGSSNGISSEVLFNVLDLLAV